MLMRNQTDLSAVTPVKEGLGFLTLRSGFFDLCKVKIRPQFLIPNFRIMSACLSKPSLEILSKY